jgi:Ca2+-binding RTX toxin-like protein
VMLGGAGNDWLLSRSDGGEPVIGTRPGMPLKTDPSVLGNSDDVLTGGPGADKFQFELTMNLDPKLALESKVVGEDGVIDWEHVTFLNDDIEHGPHGHWMDSIGNDIITDYKKSEGDQIIIVKHSTTNAVSYGHDAGGDFSLITLEGSQMFGNDPKNSPHHEDLPGTIKVYGDRVAHSDIVQLRHVHLAPSGYITAADGHYGTGIDTGLMPYNGPTLPGHH